MLSPFARSYTVWRFTSPCSGETRDVAKVSEVDDHRYAHEYQRILWRGMANNPKHALESVRNESRKPN